MKKYLIIMLVISFLTLISASEIQISNEGRDTGRIINLDLQESSIRIPFSNASFNQSLTDDLYVNVGGDTMTGDLAMGLNNIKNITELQGSFVNLSGVSTIGFLKMRPNVGFWSFVNASGMSKLSYYRILDKWSFGAQADFLDVNIIGNLNVSGQIYSSSPVKVTEGINITNGSDYLYLDPYQINLNGVDISGGGGGNSSWNQTYADTLYCPIKWDYNQTTPAIAYTDSVVNNTFNQTLTDSLYVPKVRETIHLGKTAKGGSVDAYFDSLAGQVCEATACFEVGYSGSIRGLHIFHSDDGSIGSTADIEIRVNGVVKDSITIPTVGGKASDHELYASGTYTFNARDDLSCYWDANGNTAAIYADCRVEVEYDS